MEIQNQTTENKATVMKKKISTLISVNVFFHIQLQNHFSLLTNRYTSFQGQIHGTIFGRSIIINGYWDSAGSAFFWSQGRVFHDQHENIIV